MYVVFCRVIQDLYLPNKKYPSKFLQKTTLVCPALSSLDFEIYQAANLRGFPAYVNPRFELESQILWTESQILWKSLIHFNVVNRKVDCQNPKIKSLNLMPVYRPWIAGIELNDFKLGFHQCSLLCTILKFINIIVHKIWDCTLKSGIHGSTESP